MIKDRASIPRMPDHMTPEGRAEMLASMRKASAVFYTAAIHIGCHAFIEFAGLMNQFIEVCRDAETNGRPWTNASVHGGAHLSFEGHQIAYLSEKLECIYGLRLEQPK